MWYFAYSAKKNQKKITAEYVILDENGKQGACTQKNIMPYLALIGQEVGYFIINSN